uniref:Uncharacterized protein n=1 Tax=viral metagenome TaxID=1070528 RepID=A0A6M3XXQ0_9ZZZZ
MRTLSSTLTTAQQEGGNVLFKAVFTKAGQSTRTYGVDTDNVIIRLSHTESEWSQKADVIVENGDGTLTALDLTGYTATISFGYITTAGDEYSAVAPLECISQQGTTQFLGGNFFITFTCAGIFDMMGEDEASDEYSVDDTNTDTVKTILTAIANATMSVYSHCKNYTITFDKEDSLIDTFIPKDYFKVSFKESRLSAFKKVLKWTKCKARIEANGAIHVFNPTISGSTYDYEYNDAVSNHNFFEKSVRNRLVIPNKVVVSSSPDHENQYTGNDTDATSYAALGRYINQYHWIRLASNAQATAIATAILQGYQVGQENGHGSAPLNCGQEVMDYVKITDSAAGDTRTGNIGYIRRICEQGKFDMEFRFGALDIGGISALVAPIPSIIAETTLSLSERYSYLAGAYETLADMMDRVISNQQIIVDNIVDVWGRDTVPKWHVVEQLIIPVVS